MNIADGLRALTTLIWVAVFAVIILAVVRAGRGSPFRGAGSIVIGGIVLALVLTVVSAGLVFVQPQERAVVISAIDPAGFRGTALTPGLKWIFPFFENVQTYPVSRQTYTMSIAPLEGQIQGDDSVAARTSDGQSVLIDGSVIFAVDPNQVIDVHIRWQNRYEGELVRPQARGIIRDEASQFRVDQIVSERRADLTRGIELKLEDVLAQNGLILHDFVLRNIQFTPEYAASVEQKQIAEQEALRAEFIVEQRRQEAEQRRQVAQGEADAAVIAAEGAAEARLIQADAEAKALALIAAALRDNPEVLTFEYISRLAPGIRVMLLPSDNPFLLPLPDFTSGEQLVLPTPEPAEQP